MIPIPDDALGKELILDLHDCDVDTFLRESVEQFCIDLCKEIDMQAVDRFIWEYLEDETREDFAHYKGLSVVQFILTSDIVIHTWDNLRKASLNIYSCKNFDEKLAEGFCIKWFRSKKVRQSTVIIRY